jgi:hypothetical protein
MQRVQRPCGGLVLGAEGVDWMTGDRLRPGLGVQRFTKDRDVDVAQPLDLHLRQPLVNQGLLDPCDFLRTDVAQQRGELSLDLIDGLALVEIPDESLQDFLPLRSIVDMLTNLTSPCREIIPTH